MMTSLPLESPSGGVLSSEEKDNFVTATQKFKRFQHFIQELLQLEKGPCF